MKGAKMGTILSLIAIGWGYWTYRRAGELETRLENVRNSHFRLADKSRDKIAELEEEVNLLTHKLRMVTNNGQLYHGQMTIGEAAKLDARVSDVLGGFHIGNCSSCAVNPTDTLEYAALSNGQDVEIVLNALNKLNTAEGHQVMQMVERAPNVQLSL